MNYLAHAYLSFGQEPVLVGNMISDFVKGAARFGFPPLIQQGIILHRNIDAFTDVHPATAEAKEVFRPHYRLYSGALVDIVYDHFLANDLSAFAGGTLHPFTQATYETLARYADHLPPRFQPVFAYMRSENWLWRYREVEGTEKSFRGLIYRAAYISDSTAAGKIFREHYEHLKACYGRFIPDVKEFSKMRLLELQGEIPPSNTSTN